LSGEEIPIGARILSAVDCLDALASDRQYRRALPLDDAMAHVERESGKAFDPKVVAALKSRYVELEQLARSQWPEERPKLSVDIKVERGAAPDAGFATAAPVASPQTRQPMPETTLATFAEEILSLEELLSIAVIRMRHLVSYDAIAIYMVVGDILAPRLVLGENMRQLASSRVRMGEGLVGWVAETGNSIVNGNPAVDLVSVRGKQKAALGAALALPLRDNGRMLGVLAVYRLEPDSFNAQHLGALESAVLQLELALRECLCRKETLEPDRSTNVSEKPLSGEPSRTEVGSLTLN
jgi:GAF domain-containing protein